MKPCEKSFDRFRNLLIILSRLCYTFIHSMSLRFVIVFWRLNYTKTIGFMLFLCQLLLNFQGAKAHFNVRSLSYYKIHLHLSNLNNSSRSNTYFKLFFLYKHYYIPIFPTSCDINSMYSLIFTFFRF